MDTLVLNKDGNPLSVIPLSVIGWQSAIRLVTCGKVSVIKEYDNWFIRSPSTEMAVPSIVMTLTYVKWNRRVKYNRTNVLLRDNYTCQYCYDSPSINKLTLDHVLPRKEGGKTNWDNITTACIKCNSSKGHNKKILPKNKPYRPNYYELMAKRQKYPVYIREKDWEFYLQGWPKDLIKLTRRKK